MKILMCPPDYYRIAYEINPWMKTSNPANFELAGSQWHALKNIFESLGVHVEIITPQPSVPDMVFTANCGFMLGCDIYMSTFAKEQRAPERTHYAQWFKNRDYRVWGLPLDSQKKPPYFEGAGDALHVGKNLFVASGFRSDKSVPDLLKKIWPDMNVIHVELTDPYFYHLDTCFCPLNNSQALIYPPAFSQQSFDTISQTIDCIEICQKDALKFACNAVVIGHNIVMAQGCSHTKEQLESLGWNVHECDLSEYQKAGGSAKCLTFKLENNYTDTP